MSNILPPIGIYNSVKEWIQANPGSFSQGVIFKEIYQASSFSRRIKYPPIRYPIKLEGGSVGVIPGGRVCGLNGAILTPDNHLIWDVSLEFVHPRSNHSIFKEKELPPISQHVEKAVDLTHIVGGNYYHWMYETLPRIHLLKQSGINADLFIVKPEPRVFPFQIETLNELGITADQLIKTHSTFHIEAENLIVPSQPSFATKWAYDFLRCTFLKDSSATPYDQKRIYITRRWSRKILNEDHLMEVLTKYGFIKIELETLSVAEQAKLFSTAEAIVAPHGAGLVNLTFCQPDTKVVEIFPPTYITPLYWAISSFGNLNYRSFIGLKDPEKSPHGWNGLDNITINIPKFTALLRNIKL
ncbi:glycosyltransferase family 61 protein [Paenibacillus sp. BSR1-1]|uniref:glycosyltransferase family 61 protein n=1 Tax=Paenibacillus sp. BSR1-1 TaxID=3020845 RepID=UPI0025AF21F2|nr:glycosyltransferase family 61 protein [Paenibacillus sp. BSR1-1]MDN3017853.1 glycosyltransferase family 61 protein [Paenibacillus sp. BSR1-1]